MFSTLEILFTLEQTKVSKSGRQGVKAEKIPLISPLSFSSLFVLALHPRDDIFLYKDPDNPAHLF
jgi:hypothetical protein